ncbi:MAG: hypothetical protein VYE18_09700 [Pseudomonadota bacterium]|nr:hypothetical protein [Pseudomonadota bacterium]
MASNKGLIIIVISLGALIFLGLGAVAVGIIFKSSAPSAGLSSSQAPGETRVVLPAGADIVGVNADDDLLHLHIEANGNTSIWTVDPVTGRVRNKIHLVGPKPGQKMVSPK